MNEQLQLFFHNVEKIRLYFGSEAAPFEKELALKLTVRNIPFYYEDYEKVVQQIKANTKWYSSARAGQKIYHNYYVHFAKAPEQIVHTLHMYKQLTKHFKRNEQTYLAAMYMKHDADIQKLQTLTHELAQQPSLTYSALKLSTTALLSTRENNVATLVQTYELYYKALISLGYERVNTTKNSAVLLTLGTGTFCDETNRHLQQISQFIRKSDVKIERCHYNTIALLALAKFKVVQFPALYAIHDEICRELNIKKYDCNSLLLAAQIYTSNEAIGDLPESALDFNDMLHIDAEVIGDVCSDDSGGGD
ncbi:DUF4003 domain-containing protein [Solibacillus sp. MA9]|uniref:DUF4003 domain-containing protein n=1 Tax=Solibacillus palustris TaxID=2908203 RepID=A0ABS9UFD4_9BACL|nr:DUF4003 family protein [Solibacillus sp. MA9]MCH7322978.1 DUF4003 domain-containing protein [Solibacillus sp. MA9]